MNQFVKVLMWVWLGLVGVCLRAGTVLEVTESSAVFKIPTHIRPGGVDAVKVSSTSLDLFANGVLTAQFVQSPTNGAQLLLKGQTISETPHLASFTNPLSGLHLSSFNHSFIVNRAAMWSIGRNGLGVGQIVGNAVHRKDSDDTRLSPSIETEGNHDGVTWIDNRMPDGVLGHDATGRFIRFQVGGNNTLSVGRYGVQIGTYTFSQGVGVSTLTVSGVVESTSGGFKFPDGTLQTSAAQGQSATPVLDYIVLTPRATPPANPAEGTLYINSSTKQAYWWDGGQWLVAW